MVRTSFAEKKKKRKKKSEKNNMPDHNFFVFPDRSMIFGMWVHDHKAVCRVP
jgi:leucyl aminopeptidase (aminopeptidase T)